MYLYTKTIIYILLATSVAWLVAIYVRPVHYGEIIVSTAQLLPLEHVLRNPTCFLLKVVA